MDKIVITGATGFIGIHLIQEWMKRDCEIFLVVRPHSNNLKRIPVSDRIHIIELGMNDYDRLPKAVVSTDYFYHLAWEGARAPYRDDVTIQENNYNCAIEAFQSAVKMGCSFFLGSGSQAEYGNTNGLVDENYPCMPNTEYGKQKLRACQTIEEMAAKEGMRSIWTRIFSIYGPYDYPGTLIMQCLDKMNRNEPIEMTEGTQLWDYLYVADAARAMAMFPLNDCGDGVYNIASGDYKPLKSFVEKMKEITQSESDLLFGEISYGPSGPVNLTPDPSKVKKALKWEPSVTFEEGIRSIIRRRNGAE